MAKDGKQQLYIDQLMIEAERRLISCCQHLRCCRQCHWCCGQVNM